MLQKAITNLDMTAVLDTNSAFNNKIFWTISEQQTKRRVSTQKTEREDEDRSGRMGQIQAIINRG